MGREGLARWRGTARLMAALSLVALAGCATSVGSVGSGGGGAAAGSRSFADWLAAFKTKAVDQGIPAATVERAFRGVRRNPQIVALDSRQPEYTRPIWAYLDSAVSKARIVTGRALMLRHRALLDRIAGTYGVAPRYLVAIWGIETNYGRNMGHFDLFEALATLGYDGRRRAYGLRQLMPALRILDRGDLPRARMVGSWAGALGQTQFVPSTYLRHAVDGDGDGRRDLVASLADALASTARYLAVSGWRVGRPWGYEVRLPTGFDWASADLAVRKPVSAWRRLGVRRARGGALPAGDAVAAIYLPAGHTGPAFLVADNFRALLRYNNAGSYALAVGRLADRLAGGGGLVARWPRTLAPLSRDDKRALQSALAARGYDPGPVDGVVGSRTRAALRAWQKAEGLPADGFATVALLARLRGAPVS